MSTIVTRAGKGSPLTNNELDANFVNLNTDKYQSGDSASFAQVAVDNILVNGNTISSTDTNGNIVLSPNGSGTVDVASSKITGLAAPTASTDAATKQYVDETAEGLKAKPSARAATTTNLAANYDNGTAGVGATLTADTNRAFGTLDGVTGWAITSPPQGVLVKNQTNAAHNGRYNLTALGEAGVSPWVLTRCSLCDTASEIPGSYTFVVDGTANKGTGWVQTVADPATFVVGTDAITILQFSGAGTYTAGTGLSLTGTEFAVSLVPIANGGTGQTTANAALNAFLPSQATNADKFLKTDGTNTTWANVPSPNNGTLSMSVSGTGLSGSASFTADQSGSSTFTVTSNATSANTVSTIVARDASGNFSAGTITAALSGNATTATTASATSADLTAGTYLTSGGSFNGSTARTFAVDATSANTASKVVARDASGNFSAGTITATFSGNLTGNVTGNVTGNTSGSAATFTSTTQNSQFNSVGVGTAASTTAGEIRATNNITAYYSDERLKTKIGSIENALEKVKQIETMVYHANETAVALGYDASIIEVGVTAQSVERVMPQTVAPAPIDDKYLTVRYERLVPLLIEAIKELEAQVAELKGK
jgi:hypothetical protein